MPLDTIKSWIGGLVLVGIAAYICWVGPSVLWYSMQYHVSPDKVSIDPEPTDCDFWHAPIGLKGCHYERLVAAQLRDRSGKAEYRYDPKTGDLIDLRANEKASGALRPSEPDSNARYDSVWVSWVKKSD